MRIRDFTGKNVFIVGGSSGIGLAAARQLAGRGAHITIFARRLEVLQEAATEIRSARVSSEQRIEYAQLDAADPAHVQEVMRAAVSELEAPDLLINCAGRAQPSYFQSISHEQLGETLQQNLATCWNTISTLLPSMQEGGGYIVNTASLAGLIGVFGYTDYCAAKFAVVGFSEALRSELKRYDITVSVLCPPDTETPALAAENETKPPETQAISAGMRVLSADAVATALLRGVGRGQFLILPGASTRFGAAMKRFAPRLVEWVNDRAVARSS